VSIGLARAGAAIKAIAVVVKTLKGMLGRGVGIQVQMKAVLDKDEVGKMKSHSDVYSRDVLGGGGLASVTPLPASCIQHVVAINITTPLDCKYTVCSGVHSVRGYQYLRFTNFRINTAPEKTFLRKAAGTAIVTAISSLYNGFI